MQDETRNGEWGDHVTLQAAADLVWIMNCSIFPSYFIWSPKLIYGFVFLLLEQYVGFHNGQMSCETMYHLFTIL